MVDSEIDSFDWNWKWKLAKYLSVRYKIDLIKKNSLHIVLDNLMEM